jgi:hypothetical protein
MDTTLATLRAAVEQARLRRHWTRNDAAEASGLTIRPETWRAFERADYKLTPRVRTAVARAYGWPDSWPEELPADDDVKPQAANLHELAERIERLADNQEQVTRALAQLTEAVLQLGRQLDAGPRRVG